MAKLDFNNVYEYRTWIVFYDNAMGYQEKFLKYCDDYANKTEFPNLMIETGPYVSGGMFHKETTEMLCLSFEKSSFKNLGVYFRAQQFGNVLIYSLIKSVERGVWDKVALKDTASKLTEIRNKCKNLAEIEEFESLQDLGDLIFVSAMKEFDPRYKENRELLKTLA